MEGVVAVGSSIAGRSSVASGIVDNSKPCGRGVAVSQVLQICRAQISQRKLGAAEDSTRESGRTVKAETDICVQDWRSVVFASLAPGLANVGAVFAITDDEVVGSASDAATEALTFSVPEIDPSTLTESLSLPVPEVDTSSLIDFVSSNPLVVLGGGAVLALPFIVSAVFNKSQAYGVVSAKDAYTKLGAKELLSEILDIRAGDDVKTDGTPNVKGIKKRVTQLPYTGEPADYLAKVIKKFKDAENTTIFVLDRFDGNSSTVAKLLATGGFKAAYAIKDGAEGPNGWQKSDLPWLAPSKLFSLDLGTLKELFSSDNETVLPATLGVAAAAGVGLVVFSEAETALQLLGSVALIQVFIKKFLFAKDRKQTIKELQTFLDTKVAPKELVDELKGIAGVLLPKFEAVQSTSVNGSASIQNPLEGSPPVGEKRLSLEADPAAAETFSSSTDLPATPNPLSPYAQYPDLKPPTSPTPARP